jgi:branched-chain amino acid transport system substrate-binding protein
MSLFEQENFMTRSAAIVIALLLASTNALQAQAVKIPIIVPITGPIALEGTSQRNGALLAVAHGAQQTKVDSQVFDPAGAAEGGANALDRTAGDKSVVAAVAPLFGTQVLPMIPLADEYKVPLITTSGTGAITEKGSAYIYRFFPSDEVTKLAQAKYVVETLGKKRIAILYNATAYGQSGLSFLTRYIKQLGGDIVYSDGIDLATKDMTPVIANTKAANPDVILLQMHTASMALLIKQLAQSGLGTPVVANTMLTMPSTTALLEPADLKGVCAETSSWVGKGVSPALDKFVDDYQAKYGTIPDFFALNQYDGMMMVLKAINGGAKTAADVQKYLATNNYDGIGMSYKSDGKGNMAHSAVVVCFDGVTRAPKLVHRYDNVASAK